jgi:uncharacterized small protein (DUF1192 family)
MTELIIVGDEAYTPEELERMLRRQQKQREYRHKWEQKPEVKERLRVYGREYKRRVREGRPYRYLTYAQLDARIAQYQARLERLVAERERRKAA